jgi:hypothetical protein
MSRDYTFKNLPKFTTYPGGSTDGSAVLMTAADGSLVTLTFNGLNALLDSEATNTFPSINVGNLSLSDSTIVGNAQNTDIVITPSGTGQVRVTKKVRIDNDLIVYGAVFTPNQPPIGTQITFQPIIQDIDCGDLSAAGTDAFGVYLNYNFVTDLNFAGPLSNTDLGALT